MTLEELKELPPHTVFATGISNTPRLHSEQIRWVAKRGYIHDWAVYYSTADKEVEEIMKWGSKIHSLDLVKELVVCDEPMIKMYRQ
jgi:hypothetical protein